MTTRRRAIRTLTAALGAAAGPKTPSPAATGNLPQTPGSGPGVGPAVRDSSFDPCVEVRAEHLCHNVAAIGRRVENRPIIGVIKDNGYGAGTAAVGRILDGLPGIAALAVVKLHEALVLRDAGVARPVLLMGPLDDRDLEEAVTRGIEPMVYTPVGGAFDRIATKRQRPAAVHVCVDTGIGRVGVPFREAGTLIRDLAARRSVVIGGTMMTFTEDPEFDAEQLRRFKALSADLEREGIRLGRKHAASSFALFRRPHGFLDAVRPGNVISLEPTLRMAGEHVTAAGNSRPTERVR